MLKEQKVKILSVNISTKKGTVKSPVERLVLNHLGVEGDAHAGEWHRQVSLLGIESFERFKDMTKREVKFGDFAENITTSGIDLVSLPVGTRMAIGGALVEVTQIGKECHAPCAIYYQAGSCVMPKEGIFVKVLEGGRAEAGSPLTIL